MSIINLPQNSNILYSTSIPNSTFNEVPYEFTTNPENTNIFIVNNSTYFSNQITIKLTSNTSTIYEDTILLQPQQLYILNNIKDTVNNSNVIVHITVQGYGETYFYAVQNSNFNNTNPNTPSVSMLPDYNNLNIPNSPDTNVVVNNSYLPLGSTPNPFSLTQTTNSGYIYCDNVKYTIYPYTNTYPNNSDTYEYVNSSGYINRISVANGATAPTTPSGYVPFQKVVTQSLSTPNAPLGNVVSGGSLAAGTYDYQIVMKNNTGNSLPSQSLSITLSSTGSVDLAWRLVPYTTSVDIYRNGYYLATVDGQTYTDTGTATTSQAVPTTNTSGFVAYNVPLYNVINTNNNKVINLGLFGPQLNTDITALLLGVLEYASSIYESSFYYTQYSMQPSYLINAVKVVIPDGQYYISEGVTIPSGITLDFEGLLINNCLDLYTPPLTFGPGSFSNSIQLNANNKYGIVIGQASQQNNIHIGSIRIANVGGTYNSVLNMGQQGVTLTGYDITIFTLQVFLGSIGLSLYQASDVRIGRAIIVGPYQGFEIIYSEQVGIDYLDMDTPTGLAGMIDSSHDLMINGVLWINGSSYGGSANTRAFLNIGSQSASNIVAGLNLRLNLLNCGDIPLSVENIDQSVIDVVVGTGNLYTGTNYPPQSVISYGSNVGSGFLLKGTAVIPTTSNWANGI